MRERDGERKREPERERDGERERERLLRERESLGESTQRERNLLLLKVTGD